MIKTLLKVPFNTPYNTPPFSKIENEDFLPAFKESIKKAKKEIDDIVKSDEKPTFKSWGLYDPSDQCIL